MKECTNRFGVDICKGEGDTWLLRSAHMGNMPMYYDPKKKAVSRPPNYFLDVDETRLAVAMSPQNVCDTYGLGEKAEATKLIKIAFENAQADASPVPIRVSNKHVFWATATSMGRDKMEFKIVGDELSPMEVADVPAKRARTDKFQKVVYNGISFDDDDEARHAFFWDLLDVKYKTQPTCISHPLLMDAKNTTGIYRTDFFLPSLNAYVETTGTEPSARKHFTCELLARNAFCEGRSVYLIYGGLNPPRRDSYTSQNTETMKIIKYIVEVHRFENGREELVVVADDGYAWMQKNGTYVIDKLGSVMNRAWDHPPLRDALNMARTKVFS